MTREITLIGEEYVIRFFHEDREKFMSFVYKFRAIKDKYYDKEIKAWRVKKTEYNDNVLRQLKFEI